MPCTVVQGGATRADSVCNGLRAAKGQLVAIHDAARPFVSEQVITDALAEAEAMGAAAPAVAVKDTIKIANDGAVVQTPDRAALFAVQTPQCFRRNQTASHPQELRLYRKASLSMPILPTAPFFLILHRIPELSWYAPPLLLPGKTRPGFLGRIQRILIF